MSEENTTPETPAETPAPQPGSAEYNAQVAAEGSVALGQVPEKFLQEDGTVNMEAFTKSYLEMEKQFHAPKTEAPVAEPVQEADATVEPETPVVEELRVPDPVEPEVESVEAPKELITNDEMDGYIKEIMATGDISDASKSDLIGRGIPEGLITSMVAGHRATMQQQYADAGQVVGGKERLDSIFRWAADNLPAERRQAINEGLKNDGEATLLGLAAMYDRAQSDAPKAQEPREAPRYAANPAGQQTIQGFVTKADMYAAMGDPKYQADPKFRAEVEARMRVTDMNTIR